MGRRRAGTGIATLLLAAGCGRPESSPVRHLAEGFRPAAIDAADAAWSTRHVQELERDDWYPTGWPRIWSAALEIGEAVGTPTDGAPPYTLTAGERDFEDVTELVRLDRLGELPDASFAVIVDQVYLVTEAEPPARASLSTHVDLGREEGGTWRVSSGRIAADGLPTPPGSTHTLVLPAGEEARLSTGTALRVGSLALAAGRTWTFRVLLDGAELLRADVEPEAAHTTRWLSAPVPSSTRARELVFECAGPPAVAAFLSPRVHAIRDEANERPDVALLVADTFRADNLSVYGSAHAFAPFLDEHAARSTVFLNAWTPSSWTLPSQASLLSGLHPRQHGATSSLRSLPGDIVTLAELLRSEGYRTVAVTDGLYVSEKYGMDQGFEVFDEAWEGMAATVERTRAALASDDGRPTFVFVQSYAVHAPYAAGERARARVTEWMGPLRTWEEITADIDSNPWDWQRGEPVPDGLAELVAELERLYRAGVVDFDGGVASLMEVLRDAGFGPEDFTVFTSDHGEAFGEHLELYHGNSLWEEVLRVPLVVSGPGWSAETVETPVDLLDVAPTIARWVGLEPAGWGGRYLGAVPEGRNLYSFGCFETRDPDAVAVREGDHKAVLHGEDGRLLSSWDLRGDPDETHDAGESEWARRLEEEARRRWSDLTRPHAEQAGVDLSPTERNRLRALGYLGD